MTFLQLLPVALSFLLLGAHFMRAGETLFVALSAGALALLAVPRPWAARAAQVLLLAGAFEWVRSLTTLVAERQQLGLPFTRLALIIGAVALWTAASTLLFGTGRLVRRFRLETHEVRHG
jgi:hypothetical protein